MVHISVLPDSDSQHWSEIDAISDAAVDDTTSTRDVYLEFLERFRTRFVHAVEAVAEAPEGTVVIHCLGGKDRTGLLTALLLRLADVPIAEIAADYALSAGRLTTLSKAWIEEATSEDERRRRVRFSAAPAEAGGSARRARPATRKRPLLSGGRRHGRTGRGADSITAARLSPVFKRARRALNYRFGM